MNEPFELPPIRVPERALAWARAHPSFFFPDGVVSSESLVKQLIAGARALAAQAVEARAIDGWFVVAAPTDWYASARFPIPEDFNFHELTPFPELGQNCVRPECIVAAFADEIVVRGPAGTHVVKGSATAGDPILVQLSESPVWQRAIAFQGMASA